MPTGLRHASSHKPKQNYYNYSVNDARHSNPTKWFKSIHALTGCLQRCSTTGTSESVIMADELLKAFTDPWKDRKPTTPQKCDTEWKLVDCRQSFIPNIGQVKAALKRFNSRKATGPDGVPAWLLKQFNEELAPVVHDITCTSIRQSKYPTAYKYALISPVPKVTNPVDINNDFRQISALPQIAKVLERFQLNLNKQDLKISNNQHAFSKKGPPSPLSPVLLKTGLMLLILVVHALLWTSVKPSTWSTTLRCYPNYLTWE